MDLLQPKNANYFHCNLKTRREIIGPLDKCKQQASLPNLIYKMVMLLVIDYIVTEGQPKPQS